MEKPIFPSKHMRITQGYQEGTHKDSYAIDNAGKDYNIEEVYAPFTGIVKKIYPNDANEVWLESKEPVEYPDGTIDYMTILFVHANDISNLFVGKEITQNEPFYKEGTKGNATGNHCHIECARGRMEEPGWHKNNSGYWSINNGKKPEECLWIEDDIEILDNYGYSFKKIEKEEQQEQKESTETVDKTNDKEKIFTAPKTDLYGVYLKENQQLVIKELS